MTTRSKLFSGAPGTTWTELVGSPYKMPSGASKIIGIAGVPIDNAAEAQDLQVKLELDDTKGPFEFPLTGGVVITSGASIAPVPVFPVDIPVQGGATEVKVYARSSVGKAAVAVAIIWV